MAGGDSILDPDLVENFRLADRAASTLAASGVTLELWEALRLAQAEGSYLRQEIDRVASLYAAGKSVRLGTMLVESVERLRRTHGRQARAVRALLDTLPQALDPGRLEITLALAFATPSRRAGLDGWIATPGPVIDELTALADASGELARTLRTPEGIDPELFEDLREAAAFVGRVTETLELWQVLPLAVDDRESLRRAAEALGSGRPLDRDEAPLRVLEAILDFQDCWGSLADGLRQYARTLPMGSYGPGTIDLAVGFILASPEARRRAEAWLEDPDRSRRDAALTLEGVIGKAQNYERALRTLPA
jgi:hypothetical protein